MEEEKKKKDSKLAIGADVPSVLIVGRMHDHHHTLHIQFIGS
jgi:hypothetical protein